MKIIKKKDSAVSADSTLTVHEQITNLEKELAALTNKLEKMEAKETRYMTQVAKLNNTHKDLTNQLKKRIDIEMRLEKLNASPAQLFNTIDEMQKRTDYLSNRLQTLINRECVLTEVSRYVRSLGSADLIVDFHLAIMRAYNWDDEFWEQPNSREFSIKEWLEKIMTLEDAAPISDMQLLVQVDRTVV